MRPKRSHGSGRSASTCHRAWNNRPASKITRASRPSSRFLMASTSTSRRDPDARGYYGEFGGRYVPETLVAPIEELEEAYLAARADADFQAELARLLTHYVGRPTPIYEAARLTQAAGGATIYLKRED